MCAQGFHEFAEFTAEDVGTVDSGLNSCVLANNSEMILLPVNEPRHIWSRTRYGNILSFLCLILLYSIAECIDVFCLCFNRERVCST